MSKRLQNALECVGCGRKVSAAVMLDKAGNCLICQLGSRP